MNTRLKLLIGAVAVAGFAVPAAAQSYPYPAPQYQYPQQAYPQYQYPQQAYPQYQYPQQQPAYAYPGQQGYGQQNVIAQMINQLLGNRHSVSDRTAATQCASAAMTQAAAQYRPAYPQQYGQGYGHPGYQQGYQGYSGYNHAASMRVTAITDVRRQDRGMRVSGLMSSGMHAGYMHPGMPGPGYGQQHQVAADLNFRCNVAYNGQVTSVRVRRNPTYTR